MPLKTQNLRVLPMNFIESYHEGSERVFVLHGIIEIRIPSKAFQQHLDRGRTVEEIISSLEPRILKNHVTGRNLVYVTRESGIPLRGHNAFGLIDRGTNVIQVRPISGCNMNCIFCAVDEGRGTKTRATDYIVEPEYLLEEFRKIAELKGAGIEAHIDGQGEPFLYPYMVELVKGVKSIPEVNVVSAQTNGMPLNEKLIQELEPYMSRINLSINAIDSELAAKMAGTTDYDLNHVMNVARIIADSEIDLLIAPVWVPGWNDNEITRIIDFAMKVGAGRVYPPLGLQKYLSHKNGRKVRAKRVSFPAFYERLRNMEKEHNIKLVLEKSDFGIVPGRRDRAGYRKGDVISIELVEAGRLSGEVLGICGGRTIAVITRKAPGSTIKAKIVRVKDDMYLAEG